jgi:hypothetical protein
MKELSFTASSFRVTTTFGLVVRKTEISQRHKQCRRLSEESDPEHLPRCGSHDLVHTFQTFVAGQANNIQSGLFL